MADARVLVAALIAFAVCLAPCLAGSNIEEFSSVRDAQFAQRAESTLCVGLFDKKGDKDHKVFIAAAKEFSKGVTFRWAQGSVSKDLIKRYELTATPSVVLFRGFGADGETSRKKTRVDAPKLSTGKSGIKQLVDFLYLEAVEPVSEFGSRDQDQSALDLAMGAPKQKLFVVHSEKKRKEVLDVLRQVWVKTKSSIANFAVVVTPGDEGAAGLLKQLGVKESEALKEPTAVTMGQDGPKKLPQGTKLSADALISFVLGRSSADDEELPNHDDL